MKRVFLIVIDGVGVGALPDADRYNDSAAHTMLSICGSPYFSVPTLKKMGLGNIDGLDFLGRTENPTAAFGKMAEVSVGKDTTTGHWEIAGLNIKKPFPTYPNGFPKEIIEKFCEKCGVDVLCNKPYSGTEVIKDFGVEHIKTGKLIVYTSADSVFQIAAHEDIVPTEKLYEYCCIAREILIGDHGVGRVIARPFSGEYPFVRTPRRHDYSLKPIGKTVLDALLENNLSVISVGKINDIFASSGITKYIPTVSNADGMEKLQEIICTDFHGLCFVNLVDFDMLYGHRNDVDGYAKAISEFDSFLGKFISELKKDDLLIITADHGCDPADQSTDHTREYTPLLVYGGKANVNLGIRGSFADIAATLADIFGIDYETHGKSFKKDIEVI